MIHNIPQPDFEKYVAQKLAHDSSVQIQKGVGFVACDQVYRLGLLVEKPLADPAPFSTRME